MSLIRLTPWGKHFLKLKWCVADGQSSGENWSVASNGPESQLEKHWSIKGAFCNLFLWVSDPLSALDWLILTLVSSTWTWSECKSQVSMCVCLLTSEGMHQWHVFHSVNSVCVCFCTRMCMRLTLWLWLLWSLSETWGDWQYPLLYHPSIFQSVCLCFSLFHPPSI